MMSVNILPALAVPAGYVVLLTAALLVLVPDWRVILLLLVAQYGALALLWGQMATYAQGFVGLVVGLFTVLILYVTVRQTAGTRWAKAAVAAVPPWQMAALLVALVGVWGTAVWLAPQPELLPRTLAMAGLLLFGLWRFFSAQRPLAMGVGSLMLLEALMLFFLPQNHSAVAVLFLTVAQLAIALVVSYLAQRTAPTP